MCGQNDHCPGCGAGLKQSLILQSAFVGAVKPFLDAVQPDHKLEPPCAEIGPNNVDDVLDYVNWAMDTVRSSNTDAWDAVVFSDNPHNALTGEEPLLPVKYFGMLFCFELVKEGFIESADIPFERLGFEVLLRNSGH